MWVKMCECEDVWMWVKMWMWRCVNVKMCECEDVWMWVKMCECEDVWMWVKMCEVKPKIASSIDWLEEKKEVGNRPKNTGWISVDRITQDTLSTYNTWIQISRLQKIYHPHWAKWLFASTPLTASEGSAHRSRSLLIGASHWGWWTTLLSQHGFRLRGVQS